MSSFQRIEPAFQNNKEYREHSVPVLFAANEYFLPYTGVMIQSILDHASDDHAYDIIIFHGGVSQTIMDSVAALSDGYPNVSIRFLNVKPLCEQYTFEAAIDTHVTVETFYRLLAGEALSEAYDRIIYLDGDMVALTDVAELCEVDLQGYYLAAVRDSVWINFMLGDKSSRQTFEGKKLGLDEPGRYFNAGMLVMNLALLRRDYPGIALLELAVSRKWKLQDQDVLNVICNGGKARLLHPEWNVQKDRGAMRNLPAALSEEVREGELHPRIVHYTTDAKPWKQDVPRQEYFWRTAAKTPFFSEIVERMLRSERMLRPGQNTYEKWREELLKDIAAIQKRFCEAPPDAMLSRSRILSVSEQTCRRLVGESMKNPLLSVIVPIYNVAQYLRHCLDSLVAQTYANLELILVDDGSGDGSGEICDRYAAIDARIKVIHKNNGGVSSARNAGLAAATGEWIGWVDSDDWVEPDMFESMLFLALERDVDIAVCSRIEHYSDHRVFWGWEQTTVLDTEEALRMLVQDRIMRNYLWDKLFQRELFDGITFPTGKTFEDLMVVYRLIERAEYVACLPEAKYHYRQREDSITRKPTLEKKLALCSAFKKRLDGLGAERPQFREQMEKDYVFSLMRLWYQYYDFPKEERKSCLPRMREIAKSSSDCVHAVLRRGELGAIGRTMARLTAYPHPWAFAAARLLNGIYQLKHGQSL